MITNLLLLVIAAAILYLSMCLIFSDEGKENPDGLEGWDSIFGIFLLFVCVIMAMIVAERMLP